MIATKPEINFLEFNKNGNLAIESQSEALCETQAWDETVHGSSDHYHISPDILKPRHQLRIKLKFSLELIRLELGYP